MSDDNSFLWTACGWFSLVRGGMSHCCADPAPRKRILICDDHCFFAACLRTLLENEPDLSVCGIIAVPAELPDRIGQLQPDLLVIDISLGAECGFDVGRGLRAKGTATPILFVSTLTIPTPEQLAAVADAAFIRKGTTPAMFLGVLRGLLSDGNVTAPSAAPTLAPIATEG